MVLNGTVVDEAPQVICKTAELRLNVQKQAGVTDSAFNLETISHNTRILQQMRHFLPVEAGYLLRSKFGKGPSIVLALSENGDPCEPGLGTL